MQWLVEFLLPFKKHTETLEGEKYPTMPQVLPLFKKLHKRCAPQLLDTPAQAALRERAGELVAAKLQPSLKQKVATFLWPKYRHLPMLEEAERQEVSLLHCETASG